MSTDIPAGIEQPPRGARLALRILEIGAIAVVFAATTRKAFDLDRFLVPKELVLHLTALLAGLFIIAAVRRVTVTRVDLLLALYLVISALSAAFATNRWLGERALGLSISAAVLFWTARALQSAGLARPLIRVLALSVVLVALTSLAQAYGLRIELFSMNRAPGGTLGNRNFVAHAAAFGFPILLLVALSAEHTAAYLRSTAGIMVAIATLVLSRSRAAWLAYAVVAVIVIAAMVLSPALRRDGRTWRRLLGVIVACGAGIAAALLIPNTLHWRSDNPYLESMKGVTNYEEGSGRGRLVQYSRSMSVALHHPLLGAGPGNWPVAYPERAPAGDKSLNPSEPGTTYNPWPSSDWVAFISERGIVATVVLLLALFGITKSGFVQLRAAASPADAQRNAALVGVVAAAVVAGAFDAVLLLALPALVIWTALGALWTPATVTETGEHSMPRMLFLAGVLAAGLAAARSAGQLAAMEIYATSSSRAALERAARFDPGNYRVRLRLASGGSRKQRCLHARAAHELMPSAEAARALARGCGER